jgi:L-lactate dehydrogenase complex protein LldG
MTPGRENILSRVRTALRSPAHRPPAPTSAPIFPPVTYPETRFREEFNLLKGELIDGADKLDEFLKPFTKIATDDGELVRKIVGESNASARDGDLGVTGCDCLIAQTGSVVVSACSSGGRALSVLPPTHLVIAHRHQIVPDLTAAIALLRTRYDRRWPSAVSVITGPSRTADIEKILVFGAHGPKRLAVYFAD